jgi:putative ABC transport system permease protein
MLLLTLRDLRHRATRIVVVIAMAAVVFALLFVMTGLVEQFNLEPYDTVDAIGADHWVVATGISGPFTAASAIPASSVDEVVGDDAAPVVVSRSSLAFDDDITESSWSVTMPARSGNPPPPTAVRRRPRARS